MDRVHKEKDVKCDQCEFMTKTQGQLKSHVDYVHKGVKKPFVCYVCDYSTDSSYGLKDHMNSHVKIKPFKCDMCDYAATKGFLNVHKKCLHTEKM